MTRKKKLLLNTASGLLYEVITLICGFILPRMILLSYGSEINGLVSSITQFLGFISLAECGVGAVVQSALYKPLADKDECEISKIIISSKRFFKRVGIIFIIYVVVLSVVYPHIINDTFEAWFTISLILAISISSFAQYFFSMSYRLLLNADQMGFIPILLQAVILMLNTIFSVLLIKMNVSIQWLKLTTSLVFLIQPVVLVVYTEKHYALSKKLILTEEPIKQKWNGLAQHIASVVLGNTDVMVLTMFSTLTNVSIYQVYYLVVNGVKQIVLSSIKGMQAMLGNMYAKGEKDILMNTFSFYEWVLHTGVVLLFTCTGILILPFVKVYTNGIDDANYMVPLFAMLITTAQASYCLRLPYNNMILAAGHFKETQLSAIIEMVLNIVISVVAVFKFGLAGVAVGTLIAMTFRTVYFAVYLSRHILYRPLKHFLQHIFVDILTVGVSSILTRYFSLQQVNYLSWIVLATEVVVTCLLITGIINVIFYRSYLKRIFSVKKSK